MHFARSRAFIPTAFAVTMLLLLGCGGTKTPLRVLPPAPRDETSAALGVTLSLTGDLEVTAPVTVVFARFDGPARDAEALRLATLVESNFVDGDHYYLLNAAPGAYAVVGARTTSKYQGTSVPKEGRPGSSDSLQTGLSFGFGTEHTRHDEIWFAREIIAATLVDVAAGAFGFAGEVQVPVAKALTAGDAAQSVLLSRRQATAALTVSGATVHRETWFGGLAGVRQDADAAARFRDATHLALGSAGWSERLRAARDVGEPH